MDKEIENKILELFYEYPEKEFTIREIAKLTKVPRATTHKYIFELKKEGIITKDNKANLSLFFKIKKTNYFIEKIAESELIEYLVDKLNPSAIILFGSIRKGESVKESDIDLFIESQLDNKIDVSGFEKKLKHKIQFFIEPNINKLQDNLFNNVINGIKIYGNIKIK